MIVKMRPWHLMSVALNMREDDIEDFRGRGVTDLEVWACQRCLIAGVSFAALDPEGIPVACFGVLDENGAGTAWLVATDRGYLYRKSMIRAFRNLAGSGLFRVIEATCAPARKGAMFLLERIGFKYCGEMPGHFVSGQPMSLFSWGPR